MNTKKKSFAGSTIAALLATTALALGGIGAASAAELTAGPVEEAALPGADMRRALEVAQLRDDYDRIYAKARKLDAAPNRRADERAIAPAALEDEVDALRKRVRAARREQRKPKFATVESVGVPSATLEAIAACESGGNPAAVSTGGDYRGKYQFSYSTWASVGGSGDPAAASVAEQDYRAALLYARAGSSPWPVCG